MLSHLLLFIHSTNIDLYIYICILRAWNKKIYVARFILLRKRKKKGKAGEREWQKENKIENKRMEEKKREMKEKDSTRKGYFMFSRRKLDAPLEKAFS